MRRLIHAAAIALVLIGFAGCSILDPGDREELRNRLAAAPPTQIEGWKRWVMNSKAIEVLKSKPENDQVGKLQCRVKAGDVWKDWNDQEPSHTVADMLKCLLNVPMEVTYEMCKDQWASEETVIRKNALMEAQIPGSDIDCRYEWDFRYEPEKMPEKMINPDAVKLDDIIDCMIASPVPPPGWVMTPELAPLLCPLVSGPGWGCPDSPATEGDPPSNGGG